MNETLPLTGDAVPVAQLDLAPPLCAHCLKPFKQRQGSGGKPQRFCSETCRRQYHTENPPTPKSGVGENGLADSKTAVPKPPTDGAPTGFVTVEYAAACVQAVAKARNPEELIDAEDCIIVAEQQQISAWWADSGNLYIAQKGNYPDDNTYIIVAPQNVQQLIDKLCDLAGIPSIL
jgi:hypothetical protein